MNPALTMFASIAFSVILLVGAWNKKTDDLDATTPYSTQIETNARVARLIAMNMLISHNNTVAACVESKRGAGGTSPCFADVDFHIGDGTSNLNPISNPMTVSQLRAAAVRSDLIRHFYGMGAIYTATTTSTVQTGPGSYAFKANYAVTYFVPEISDMATKARLCAQIRQFLVAYTGQSRTIGVADSNGTYAIMSPKSYAPPTGVLPLPGYQSFNATTKIPNNIWVTGASNCPIIAEQIDL